MRTSHYTDNMPSPYAFCEGQFCCSLQLVALMGWKSGSADRRLSFGIIEIYDYW